MLFSGLARRHTPRSNTKAFARQALRCLDDRRDEDEGGKANGSCRVVQVETGHNERVRVSERES